MVNDKPRSRLVNVLLIYLALVLVCGVLFSAPAFILVALIAGGAVAVGIGVNLLLRFTANRVDWDAHPRSRIWVWLWAMVAVVPISFGIAIAHSSAVYEQTLLVNLTRKTASDPTVAASGVYLTWAFFVFGFLWACVKDRIKIPKVGSLEVMRGEGDFLMAAEVERVKYQHMLWLDRCDIEAVSTRSSPFLVQMRNLGSFVSDLFRHA